MAKTFKQEFVDQSLHFLYGLLATAALSVFLPVYVSVPVVLLLALVREWRQHPSKTFFRLFNLDVWVIIAGQVVAALLVVFFFG